MVELRHAAATRPSFAARDPRIARTYDRSDARVSAARSWPGSNHALRRPFECSLFRHGIGDADTAVLHDSIRRQQGVSGATVEVAAGTYSESVNIPASGTSAAPILYTVAPGATVTIPNQVSGFVISGRSWITVTGFTITNSSDVGINVQDSSNVTISNNHVSYSGLQVSGKQRAGIKLGNTTNSLVVGNTSDHNSYAGITADHRLDARRGAGERHLQQRAGVRSAQAPGIRIYRRSGTRSTATSRTTTRTPASSRTPARTTR